MTVSRWQRLFQSQLPALVVALVATVGVAGLKSLALLEAWELRVYDQMMRSQPQQRQDSSLLLVTITEADIQAQKTYPLPDKILIQALEKLQAEEPKAIGLDLFRDLPIPDPFTPQANNTASNNLSQYLIAHPNVIALCKVGRADNPGVSPPAGLKPEQVGFADLPLDVDGVVRRAVLIRTPTPDNACSTPTSLAFRLAQSYLPERPDFDANEELKIGRVSFPRVLPNTGGYQGVDARGYQVLINFQKPETLGQRVTLTQLLNNEVPPAAIRNRVVMIGVTAESSNDKFITPLDDLRLGEDRTPGLLIHAQVLQQILGAVDQSQPLIWAWSGEVEWLWVYGWSLVAGLVWLNLYRRQALLLPSLATGVALLGLVGISYVTFLGLAGWLPLVPAGLGMIGTSVMVVIHQATRSQSQAEQALSSASAPAGIAPPQAPLNPTALPAPNANAAAGKVNLIAPTESHLPASAPPEFEPTVLPLAPAQPPDPMRKAEVAPTFMSPEDLAAPELSPPIAAPPEPTVLPEFEPTAPPHPSTAETFLVMPSAHTHLDRVEPLVTEVIGMMASPGPEPTFMTQPEAPVAESNQATNLSGWDEPLPTVIYDAPPVVSPATRSQASTVPPETPPPTVIHGQPSAPAVESDAPVTDISGLYPHNIGQAYTLKEPTTGSASTASGSDIEDFDAPSYSSELIPGLLAGRYKVITQLGHGGFGHTYLAEDTQIPLNPICVVKQLLPSRSDAKFLQVARRLFQREAATLAQVGQHDRIPRLLAYFEENKAFFLVQEYVKGKSLHEELLQQPVFAPNYVKQLLQEILRILVYVHSLNVVHRDIKPGNILRRDSDQQLVLIDFGAVRHIQPEDLANVDQKFTIAIGTRGYAPSEQMAGRPTFASDIYALGVVAIEALSGVSPSDLQHNSANGELIWASKTPISAQFRAVLEKMVRYNFRQRYGSAQEVLDDLENA